MKKSTIICLLALTLCSCNYSKNDSSSSQESILNSSYSSQDSIQSNTSNTINDSILSSEENDSSISISSNENISITSGSSISQTSIQSSDSSISTSEEDSTSSFSSISSSGESSISSDISSETSSSISSSISSSPIEEENNSIPKNKNNKIVLGHDNKTMTSFSFIDTLPDYFRFIYGYKYLDKADRYANGEVKISSSTNAKQGIQTAMFESNLKLEIRLEVGQINNCSAGNKIDKDLPVVTIDGFDEDGNLIRSVYINEINKKHENTSIRTYMDGTFISYLDIRFTQLPYKGSQAYNIGIRGLSLIAWPYPLD